MKRVELSKDKMASIVGGRSKRTRTVTSAAVYKDKVSEDGTVFKYKARYKDDCDSGIVASGGLSGVELSSDQSLNNTSSNN